MIYTHNLKRVADILLALMGLAALSPLLLLIAALIRIMDGAPILFRHQRVGKDLQLFDVLKFRTMTNHGGYTGELNTAASLEEKRALRAQFQGTASGDARITALGKFLRKTHLDELPQLVNVLRGDMSLIGPRPDTPVQEADYQPTIWVRRHRVRPGITGLSQIFASADDTTRRRQVLDMAYIRHCSLCLDAWIVLKTAIRMVKAKSF